MVQKKTVANDGYDALQFGFGDVSVNRVNKPMKGHFEKADVAPKRTLREFRFDNCDALNVGDIVKADTFASGDRVDVVGISKGKGYAGAHQAMEFPAAEGNPRHRPGGPITPAPWAPAPPPPAFIRE